MVYLSIRMCGFTCMSLGHLAMIFMGLIWNWCMLKPLANGGCKYSGIGISAEIWERLKWEVALISWN